MWYLYQMSKYDLPVKFSDNIKIFMKGIKQHVAAKKMDDGDRGIIGKKKMDFKVYEKICELFLPEEGEEFLFTRCFLMLEWNLMAHCAYSFFPHHVGRQSLGFSFCIKQDRSDEENGGSGLACLCHAKQSLCLPCSCSCNKYFCQSQYHKSW